MNEKSQTYSLHSSITCSSSYKTTKHNALDGVLESDGQQRQQRGANQREGDGEPDEVVGGYHAEPEDDGDEGTAGANAQTKPTDTPPSK